MTHPIAPGEGPISPAISILDVLRGVVRRRRVIAVATLVAFAGGLSLVNLLKPVYIFEIVNISSTTSPVSLFLN